MEKPFIERFGNLLIKLCGLVKLEDDPENDILCTTFKLTKTARNYAAVVGYEDGISVKVYEHLYREGKMQKLDPYFNRDGIKKFESDNVIYVVLAREDGKKRIFSIGHHTVMIWDNRECEGLPIKPEDEAENLPDKPLSQPLDLSSIPEPKPTNDGDNGHKPSDELDQATKDALAGEQLNGASKPRGSRKPRETRPEIK